MILFTMNWFSLFNSSTVPYFPFLLPPLTPSQTFYALVIIVTSAKMDNHPVSHPCGFCCSIFNSREEKARHKLTHFVLCILCRLILPTKGLLLKHLLWFTRKLTSGCSTFTSILMLATNLFLRQVPGYIIWTPVALLSPLSFNFLMLTSVPNLQLKAACFS